MLRNSFIFLDGIGPGKEQSIWSQDIPDWNTFLARDKVCGISDISKKRYDCMLEHARQALLDENSAFFARMLPSQESWRLFETFHDQAVYLDIEVSGVRLHDSITVISLYDGYDTKVMLRGINLDLETLSRELQKYKLIITFNGSVFDLPFIKKKYPGLFPDVPHLDLRTACRRVGLTGGLKRIEKKLDIRRDPIVEKIYGGDPYRLWKMYRASGDEYYRNLLIEYNEEDVVNLERIAGYVVEILKKSLNTLKG